MADPADLPTCRPKHVRARSPVVIPPPPPAHDPSSALTAPVALTNLLATLESWLSRRKPSTRGYRSRGTTRRKPASAILRVIRVTTVADAHDSRNRKRRARATSSRRAGHAGRGGRTLGDRVKAKSMNAFRSHECCHLGRAEPAVPLCEGGALTSEVTPLVAAGKLQTSRALPAFWSHLSQCSSYPRR